MAFLRIHRSLILAAALVVLAGCGGTGQLQHSSAEDAYRQGMEHFESENYDRAIRYFRAVFSYGRAGEWADDAQLYIARAYRDNGQHRLAATEYQRFMQLYRNDDRVPIAEFERAMAFYRLSPPYQLDQTDSERALSAFQLFVSRHPNHERVPEAEARIEELREKLAHKKFDAAGLYENRGMYRAAAVYYEGVFDQYPETAWADNALLGAIRSYIEYSARSVEQRQAERLQQAVEHYNRLVQVFPDSPLLDEAEALHEEAQEELAALEERRSLADNG